MAPNHSGAHSKEGSVTMAQDNDLERQRRINQSTAKLKKMLSDNPRLAERTKAMLAGDLPCPDLENQPMVKEKQLSMRIDPELIERADNILPHMANDPKLKAFSISRSTVLRTALSLGLDRLEGQYPESITTEPEKPRTKRKK